MNSFANCAPTRTELRWNQNELLAMLGHDLRSSLNGICGFLDLLTSTPLNPEQQDLLKTAVDCADDIRSLLDDVLECARLRNGLLAIHRAPVDLRGYLENLTRHLARSIKGTGNLLIFQPDPDLPPLLQLDIVKIRQIVENLVGNALKFTHDGSVVLRASLKPAQDKILWIEVQDTGPGISPDELSRIFSPFYQGEQSSHANPGVGLGLAIVDKLVATLGGSIELQSHLGVGTTVSVKLPLPSTE